MALRLVRQVSATPNITNKDDTIMTRYAYGGYNGVVKAFGSECEYTADNGIFKVLDGRIVIDGWEIDIDGAGWSSVFSSVTGTQYHSVYAEINVPTEIVRLNSTYLTGSYPEIQKGDDLTAMPNGTARLLLYNVKVENGKITEVIKKFSLILYYKEIYEKLDSAVFNVKRTSSPKDQLNTNKPEAHFFSVNQGGEEVYSKGVFIASNESTGDAAFLALTPEKRLVGNFRNNGVWSETNNIEVAYSKIGRYASEDTSKGTIEERLTRLGFKEGSVALSSGTATENFVYRQGNYVIGKITGTFSSQISGFSGSLDLGTLPENFRPKTEQKVGVMFTMSNNTYVSYGKPEYATISTDGKITVYWHRESTQAYNYILSFDGLNFGFEAPPIN